jgi:hypothetical protein
VTFVVAQICKPFHVHLDSLLPSSLAPILVQSPTTAAAKRAIIGKEQAAERVKQDLEKMSRERLLPDEKTLEKVSRYEAHLSRQLYKAMHELEALQARRQGGSVPLARLDVDGLSES